MAPQQTPCSCCPTTKADLFKVRDEIWSRAGFRPNDIICLECTEKALARKIGVSDLSPFPWWGAKRPKYYQGLVDGIRNDPTTTVLAKDGEYQLGVTMGTHFASNSTPEEIEQFLKAVSSD